MKNNKSNIVRMTIMPALLTAVIVGVGSYYAFGTQQDLDVAPACVKTYEIDKVSFAYPCEWTLTGREGATTWSAKGTVTAPDGKASFSYPSPDIGLHGMASKGKEDVVVNGKTYVMETFADGNELVSFIDMGTDINQYGYNFMLASEGTAHGEELLNILSSVKF